MDKLRSICQQFNLPVQTELLEALLASCDKDKDAQINYVEFANFLNWKDKMPTGLSTDQNNNLDRKNENIDSYEQKIIEEAMESGVDLSKTGLSQLNRLGKQIDNAHGGEYTTSASMINGSVLSDFTKSKVFIDFINIYYTKLFLSIVYFLLKLYPRKTFPT